MFTAAQFGTRLDACGACGGAWVDNALGGQLLRVGSSIARTMATMADAAARLAVDTTTTVACPDCGEPTKRVSVPDYLGRPIEIDCCGLHGTWFDRGELATITRAIEGRRAEATDKEMRLDAELAKLTPHMHDMSDDDLFMLNGALVGIVTLRRSKR